MPQLSALSVSSVFPLVILVGVAWLVVRFYPLIKSWLLRAKDTIADNQETSTPVDDNSDDNFVPRAVAWKIVSEHIKKVGRREDKEALDSLSKLLLRSANDEKTA